ncbi:non-ribosomal peptide synthetase [Streptomyces cyaneogriseus]|uniref:non-ribosomal peptide synthetase n=1 Tax=Streptomyces cyaneogriseus TaxID=68192 RepID=UPI00069B79DB|nr:non-ribosomal peptide synthetase [Streptomyces cyaneogriseus]
MERNAREAEKYWRHRLAGFREPTVLGVERPASPPGPRAVHELGLAPAQETALRMRAHHLGVDPSLLVLAAWTVLLVRYGGGADLVFGAAVPASAAWPAPGPDAEPRPRPAAGPRPGTPAGPTAPAAPAAPLPVRVETGPRQSVRELLAALAGALPEPRHAVLTADEISALSDLAPDVPLYDKAIRVTDGPAAPAAPALAVEVAVTLGPRPGLRLDHDTARLDRADAVRMLRHLRQSLAAVTAADATTLVGELDVLSPDEVRQILHEWNDTATAEDDPACLHELVERQAARTPDAVAVVQGEDRLTYAELDREAGLLAAQLASRGIGPGDFVALHLERTVRSVVALLGVLKSGAAYAPVECSLPAARVRHLLESLRCPAVVCAGSRVAFLRELSAGLPDLRHILWLDRPAEAATAPGATPCDAVAPEVTAPTAPPSRPTGPGAPAAVGAAIAPAPAGAPRPRRAGPGDLAYVIFTSGSTGTPKGVLLRHAPVVNLIRWVNGTFAVGPSDRVLFLTAFGFDLSVYDVFGPLAAGGSVRVASEEEIRDPRRLLDVLDGEPVTFWDSAPAALQQLEPLLALRDPAPSAALRLVFLSGDWIPVTLPGAVRAAFPGAEAVSLGGATEAAIWSNFHRIGEVDPEWPSIPYGRPIRNARYYILDGELRPVPVGVPGDLYIGGDCLACGYHGDPVLTARKFLPDPYTDAPGARMYHTGDRARFRAGGTLEFLGRTDSQVKVRGFRIELGEVEAALRALDGVGTAVAHVHGAGESARLTAYAVPAPGARPDPAALRERLAETLPAYMVPGDVLVLDALPATPNGKLDRRALPGPGRAATAGEAPATGLESAVAAVWAELLDRPVDAGSDFFALGGQSLLAVRAIARLKAVLGADIPIRTLLDHPRLRDFAREAAPFLGGREL